MRALQIMVDVGLRGKAESAMNLHAIGSVLYRCLASDDLAGDGMKVGVGRTLIHHQRCK